jgi:hypothetical protein
MYIEITSTLLKTRYGKTDENQRRKAIGAKILIQGIMPASCLHRHLPKDKCQMAMFFFYCNKRYQTLS